MSIEIIDVTLRDGGHTCTFDWPMSFAQEYYATISSLPDVGLIELGYWGQTAKTSNAFYNLNFEKVLEVTKGRKFRNVSIMVDYHYCSHDLSQYPTAEQDEIRMIRVCARKRDLENALEFATSLKAHTGLQVSLNIFNVSNYSEHELLTVCQKVAQHSLDYVYFADTHGALDLEDIAPRFRAAVNILEQGGTKVGMHLHDHSGKAYHNFRQLSRIGFRSTDASTWGLGKGVGNLRLEHIVSGDMKPPLLEFVAQHQEIFSTLNSPYGIVSAQFSMTDYYALQAAKLRVPLPVFASFAKTVKGTNADVFQPALLTDYLEQNL